MLMRPSWHCHVCFSLIVVGKDEVLQPQQKEEEENRCTKTFLIQLVSLHLWIRTKQAKHRLPQSKNVCPINFAQFHSSMCVFLRTEIDSLLLLRIVEQINARILLVRAAAVEGRRVLQWRWSHANHFGRGIFDKNTSGAWVCLLIEEKNLQMTSLRCDQMIEKRVFHQDDNKTTSVVAQSVDGICFLHFLLL